MHSIRSKYNRGLIFSTNLDHYLARIWIASFLARRTTVDITFFTRTFSSITKSVCTNDTFTLIFGTVNTLVAYWTYLYNILKVTSESIITFALTFTRISSIKNKIFIAADSTIFTTEWIWTIFTACITIALKWFDHTFEIETIYAFTFFILWTGTRSTRIHSKVNYKSSGTSNYCWYDFRK